jgi:hypothetical protein
MNKGNPTLNAHMTTSYRLDRKPDLSSQLAHYNTAEYAVSTDRWNDRYRAALSSKLNIFDNSRTTPNANYFGIRMLHDIDRVQHYAPAGMNGENSRRITGESFTKPWRLVYPQKL